MLLLSLAFANPAVGETFTAPKAVALDGDVLQIDPKKYTVVEAIRSADW